MSIFKKETGSNRPQPYSVGPLSMVPMKWNQYKNLTEAEKNNGTMYHITDKSYDKPDASDIPYDGETSGSEETNVQDELDKLEAALSRFRSHIGMIIHSTTLDTEAKVIEQYGGTEWIQHTGYFLRGADSGVTPDSAQKDGGNDDAVVVQHSHSVSTSGGSHTHEITDGYGGHIVPNNGSWSAGSSSYGRSASGEGTRAIARGSGNLSMSGTAANNTNWSDGTNANIPNYKSVYIWERTA